MHAMPSAAARLLGLIDLAPAVARFDLLQSDHVGVDLAQDAGDPRHVTPPVPPEAAMHVVAGDPQRTAHDAVRRLDQRRSAQVSASASAATATTTPRLARSGWRNQAPRRSPNNVIKTTPGAMPNRLPSR